MIINVVLLIIASFVTGGSAFFLEHGVKIFNGETARPGQFPYQVMLLGTSFSSRILCGGSLLSEEWVLTAAHCVDGIQEFQVHLGAQSYSNYSEPSRQIYKTSEALIHERYIAAIVANDVALVKLPTKVKFNEYIQPVSLPTSQDKLVGETVVASGWGVLSWGASQPAAQLQYAELKIISNNECVNSFNPIVISPSIVCAKGKSWESVCSGDSGGPLVLKGTRTLVGVSSFVVSSGCNNGYPGGFSRVSSFVQWIKAKTGIKS